jgi:hypothetical protein
MVAAATEIQIQTTPIHLPAFTASLSAPGFANIFQLIGAID